MSGSQRQQPQRPLPPIHRSLWTYIGAWAGSRLAILGAYQGLGWWVVVSGEDPTLDEFFGITLGFGQFIVLPAGLVVSGTVWLVAAALREIRAGWPALAGAVSTAFALLTLAEFVGTLAFCLLMMPDLPVIVLASALLAVGTATIFQFVNRRRMR
jgi:hypothetical protein